MNQETAAGHAISVANGAAAYDAAVKHLLAHKPFLARIMKECLPEYKDCSIDDIMNRYIEGTPSVAGVGVHMDESKPRIQGGNTEDKTMTEGTVFYDIRFNALAPKSMGHSTPGSNNDMIGIIINVEAQNRSNPGYSLLKRAIYYCSRLISAQKNTAFTGSDYDSIQKVYSVWVCSNAPEEERSTITAYAMREQQLVGRVVKKPEEYDLLSVVMIRLGDVPQHEDGSINEAALDQNVIGMLEILLKGDFSASQRKDILENRYGIEMTKQMETEVGHMCNLSQGVLERGMAQGMEKGRLEGTMTMLKKTMEKNHWTLEQAMAFFDLPISEKEIYATVLK